MLTRRSGMALILGVALLPLAAGADKRKVAVLEYRAGVEAVPELTPRLAERLRKTAAVSVVDPAEARRRHARVDSQLARCAGGIDCVARIGVTLDCDEVVLVALSQLGDLVVNLQRIEVDSVKVSGQVSEVLPLEGDVADNKLDAWLHQLFPPEAFKRYGFISVVANVDGAQVTFNEKAEGETPLASKVRVSAPKSYRVVVGKSGYLPFSARIDVVPDASVEVHAELAPAEGHVPWYKRWYVWGIIGGVVAGGAIGTALYLTRPDDQHDSGFIVLPMPNK